MNTNSAEQRQILLTGATGGIGSALALALAAPGRHLRLWGRNTTRLAESQNRCQAKGAQCSLTSMDLRELEASRETLRAQYAESPIDQAFLIAGVSSGITPQGELEPVEDACRTMQVNAVSTINMAATLMECMAARGRGHIVLISSIAGLYPLSGSPSYSAAKVAVAYYAQAMRQPARHRGVRMSVVYPGYVASPMSARLIGPQPMRWTADKAAAHILSRLTAGSDSIAFPFLLALGARVLHLLPMPLADFFVRRFSFHVEPDVESPLARS